MRWLFLFGVWLIYFCFAAVLIGAVTGFLAAFLILRRVDASLEGKKALLPYIKQVVSPPVNQGDFQILLL